MIGVLILAVILVWLLVAGIRYQAALDAATSRAIRSTATQYGERYVHLLKRPYDWAHEREQVGAA